MNFADDLVIDDPLSFFYFIEREFAAIFFRFGSHSCFLISPCSLRFDLSKCVCMSQVGSWLEFSIFFAFDISCRGLD